MNSIVNLSLEEDYENSKMKLCSVEQSELFIEIGRNEIDEHFEIDLKHLCIVFNVIEVERRNEMHPDMDFMVCVNCEFNIRDNLPTNQSES